jgi:rhodanese-related sulfurtransferase
LECYPFLARPWPHQLVGRTIPDLFRVYQPGTTIIVYCSAGCSASEEIGDKIRKFGLEPTSILEGGFEAWQEYQHRL